MFPIIPIAFKPCYSSFADEQREIIEFAKSIGIHSLLQKEEVRRVFVAWVREAMIGRKKEKYPYLLWLYLDACSHIYGIGDYSAGYHRGWTAGVGKFLRDGLTDEEFIFVTAKVNVEV